MSRRLAIPLGAGDSRHSPAIVLERQLEPVPNVEERLGELIDHDVVVAGRRRDAQALRSFWHGRIIDPLDIDAMLAEQKVARGLASLRIADDHPVRCEYRSA